METMTDSDRQPEPAWSGHSAAGKRKGKLLLIGFGPGAFEHITERARRAIEESEVIIGYNTYVDLIRGLLTTQEIVRTGMTEEVSRAQEAVRQAEMGKKVAVISSGDAGVYGMAGLVYEVLIGKSWNPQTGVEMEVIPGISAINSCASLLGAPVMHDACTISLSDHLTPWAVIARRVEAAASADFVIALYNPRSGRRTRQIVETQSILLRHRSPDTPVGLVKSAYRDREQVILTTLGSMLEHDIGMLTTVIIGNSTTFAYEGKMITPRGYQRKYTLDADVQPLRPHERLRTEAEPWSLEAADGAGSSALGAPGQDGDWEYEEDEYGYVESHMEDGAIAGLCMSGAAGGAAVAGDSFGVSDWAAPVQPQTHVGGATAFGVQERRDTAASALLSKERRHDDADGFAAASPVPSGQTEARVPAHPAALAMQALRALERKGLIAAAPRAGAFAVQERRLVSAAGKVTAIFEVGVSPGIANKKFTAKQMALIAELAGDSGEIEYTPNHQIILRLPTEDPTELIGKLKRERLLVYPLGDVAQVKACDFCNLEKDEAIPVAEKLGELLGGIRTPKELTIGLNGCGMACYGAVLEDIGIVYRKGAYDLFLGGKKISRNVHSGQLAAEGISADQIVPTVERIFQAYKEKGHPNERFHKFFKRVGTVAGFTHQDHAPQIVIDAVCGD